jgi:hypothetical protein
VTAAAFTGAAIYINLRNSRRGSVSTTRRCSRNGSRAMRAAFSMQASLALASALFGLLGVLADARLALARRRGADLRQLALHADRDPSGQQAPRGDAADGARPETAA